MLQSLGNVLNWSGKRLNGLHVVYNSRINSTIHIGTINQTWDGWKLWQNGFVLIGKNLIFSEEDSVTIKITKCLKRYPPGLLLCEIQVWSEGQWLSMPKRKSTKNIFVLQVPGR